jgi:hypothetical protein
MQEAGTALLMPENLGKEILAITALGNANSCQLEIAYNVGQVRRAV